MNGYGKLNEDGTLQSSSVQYGGMVSLDLFTKDENGHYYQYYLIDRVANMYLPNLSIALLNEQLTLEAQLEHWYHNDPAFRTFTMLGFDVINSSNFRELISHEILRFSIAIDQNDILENEAIFHYYDKTSDTTTPVPLESLRDIFKQLTNLIAPLFTRKSLLISQLKQYTELSEIDNWLDDSKTNLLTLKATV
jgi:hypothetical protein